MLALKDGEGAEREPMPRATHRSRNGKEMGCPLETPKRNTALQAADFCTLIPVADFQQKINAV